DYLLQMLRTALLHSAAAWKLASTSLPLSFPMKHTTVEMNFDGHKIKLHVDSGSEWSYLVYGGWYESLYGPGSCKDLISGCYFCPPTDPCDLDGLLNQSLVTVRYSDGDVVKFAHRDVTLKIGKRKISNLRIGLMVGMTFADTTSDIQPYAQRTGSRCAGALPRAAHEVYASYRLDLCVEALESATFFPLRDAPQVAGVTNAIYVSAVWVKDSYVDDQTMKLDGKSYTVVIDAGAGVTIVPEEVFSMIWEAIEVKFGADHVDRTGKDRSPTDPSLAVYVNDDGEICSRRDLVKDLPVIAIQAESTSAFEVRVSDHAQICDGHWCRIHIIDRLPVDGSRNQFLLGRPFFAQYDISFDYRRNLFGIRTSEKPVVKMAASMDAWNKDISPPCRRVVKRRYGITWLVRSCLGKQQDDWAL
ncbi:hypothetical protein FOZ63_025804, partial [Perkinsus olseni]